MGEIHFCSPRLVFGWGVNDADYVVNPKANSSGHRESCPFYKRWTTMVERGFSGKAKESRPSLVDSTVNIEWKYFTKFKRWMESQIWDGLHLDKDILSKGNKEYSSDSCCFVPANLNLILTDCKRARGQYAIGVQKKANDTRINCYEARVRNQNGKKLQLGSFPTEMEAHKAWQLGKADVIEKAILEYMLHPAYRQDVANALYLRAEDLRNDAESGKQTFTL